MVFHLFISVPVLDLYLSSLSLDYAGCFVLFDIDFGLFDPIARKKILSATFSEKFSIFGQNLSFSILFVLMVSIPPKKDGIRSFTV